jgi:acetyl-CoA C-acetyltransferase
MLLENTPIIVGVGQVVTRRANDTAAKPSPQQLRAAAAERALIDSAQADALCEAIDKIVVVRTMMDSVPNTVQPFGRCAAPAATLAHDCGISDAKTEYSVVGGDLPQSLVNEAAETIFSGASKAVLLAGSEATETLKTHLKQNIALDWSESFGEDIDRGLGDRLLSPYEYRNGLGAPTITYPAFEHAVRRRMGLSRAAYADVMASLWSRFSDVAAHNPYAQYPLARDPAFLKTASAENYPIADPYLKWHVAQDAVNQGAAVILTSVGEARRLGIDPAKWVFVHGYAKVTDSLVSERPDLSQSDAIDLTLKATLAAAGKSPSDISLYDLYSCFPCAVLLAAESLGLDPKSDDLTVTGGLPFFGGAGNNYSMHAIATIVEKLRDQRGSYGLVLANGGFLSKEAAAIYSTDPVSDWRPCSSAAIQEQIEVRPKPTLLSESCVVTVETYTVRYSKGKPSGCYVIASKGNERIIASNRADNLQLAAQMASFDPIGREAHIVHEEGRNWIVSIA